MVKPRHSYWQIESSSLSTGYFLTRKIKKLLQIIKTTLCYKYKHKISLKLKLIAAIAAMKKMKLFYWQLYILK